jgi:tRNA G18 (ribose-2'-O)-methylase SpoU
MKERFIRARRRSLLDATPGIHSCILILDGLKPDFNIGKIFRVADAFAVHEIHLINVDFFDPDPAKGSVRWVPFFQHDDFESCFLEIVARNYECITLEPGQNTILGEKKFPEKVAFIFGHEEFGLSFDRRSYPEIYSLSIPQWGHVQSLNVSVAASVVLYEYVRQHGKPLVEGLPQKTAKVNTRMVTRKKV